VLTGLLLDADDGPGTSVKVVSGTIPLLVVNVNTVVFVGAGCDEIIIVDF